MLNLFFHVGRTQNHKLIPEFCTVSLNAFFLLFARGRQKSLFQEDISTESPQIKEEFTFADPVRSSLDDQLMFRCVDPSEVLGQQRTPHMVCQQQRLPGIKFYKQKILNVLKFCLFV